MAVEWDYHPLRDNGTSWRKLALRVGGFSSGRRGYRGKTVFVNVDIVVSGKALCQII